MEILKIENLSFTYPLCKTAAIEDISITVNEGEFICVCGATGSGKSTLLKKLKPELTPLGESRGNVYYCGNELTALSERTSATSIGYVMQKPEQQIVTDKVWHELAFGLENLGMSQSVIARRVAEISAYFGIEDWYERKTSELSGGQKQMLNLASVMIMNPKVMILDEPTAQLDPIAAADFIATLKKLNRELSLTVIISEHRLEDVIPVSDKLLILDNGKTVVYDKPRKAISEISSNEGLLAAMPVAARLYHSLACSGDIPLDIREGRAFVQENYGNEIKEITKEKYVPGKKKVMEFKNVYFRYKKELKDVINGLNFSVYENEIYCILGGNGSGKTTTLSIAAGLFKPYSGTSKVFDKKIKDYKNQELYDNCLSMLPQDVQTVFLMNTVAEELADALAEADKLPFDISSLMDKHPYDLSGGEQQLVALAKVLAAKPKLLLLDEPTKGIDAETKNGLIAILKELKASGMTIVMVTHDVEFAALCADRCALFFNGNIVSEEETNEFFSGNNFYTTAISRMTGGYYSNAVTVEDAKDLCRMNGARRSNK